MNILGKQVKPTIRYSISAWESDRINGNCGASLDGQKKIDYYKRTITKANKEYNEDSKNMDWYVYAITADGTYTLRSCLGFERSGMNLSDFEVLENGKTW